MKTSGNDAKQACTAAAEVAMPPPLLIKIGRRGSRSPAAPNRCQEVFVISKTIKMCFKRAHVHACICC